MKLDILRHSATGAICLMLIVALHGQAPARHTSGFTQPEPIDFNDHKGWTQIFDGKTLKGWDGPSDVFHVEDGSIAAVSTPEHPSGTTNIIWRGGQPANFELKLEMKLEGEGANGGVQYRSSNVPPAAGQKSTYPKWNMKGYQADFDYGNKYTGQLYEQSSARGIVAWRGQVVQTEPGERPRLLGMLGTSDEMKSYIKVGDWNQFEIIADGHTLIHILNGHVMAVLVDNDPEYFQAKGLIGLEIEGPGVVKILHRNIWLKELK